MDYFREAFGGFAPQSDYDAALKLGLDSLLADERIDELLTLLSAVGQLDGVEGEPGWIIERRTEKRSSSGSWPAGSVFRAYVDPSSYTLKHPEFYCDRPTFYRYVNSVVTVYAKRHPEERGKVETICKLIAQ